MNILVLNGSPRPQGETAKMISVFKAAAEKGGHEVTELKVCRMNIHGCLACEYCHGKGLGSCVQRDDMQEIYEKLQNTDMLILASPIYYHNISGQLKCVIDRFYALLYPAAPKRLKKVAMFLASGDPDMYDGARFSYEGDFLGYLGLEDLGLFSNHDEDASERIAEMAEKL